MGNKIYKRLRKLNVGLATKLNDCIQAVNLLLQQYSKNFPQFTDHSLEHTSIVAQNASEILTNTELSNLNEDEIYILMVACYLHDIGMCISNDEILKLQKSEDYILKNKLNPNYSPFDYIRDIHHELSEKYINENWKSLHIPNEQYANKIGLIAKAHRVVNLEDFSIYNPSDFVKPSGRETVCMPYLGCIIRIADELDITNMRVPDLLYKDYLPKNIESRKEWEKHKSTFGANIYKDMVIVRAETDDQNIYESLIKQSKKIEKVLKESQKLISLLPNDERKFTLSLKGVDSSRIIAKGFLPKNIGFSFDLENIFNTFIGKNLYSDHFVAIRESLQNCIDTCRLKKILQNEYTPSIKIELIDNKLIISDNGLGMNEFIVKNYFGKLGASFYQQQNISGQFNSIGIFGIGIFSYFLMSEYFDVETKAKDSKTLHFRVTKDSESNFYFYENVNRQEEGTTVTIYLNEDSKLDFDSLDNLVNYYVPYLEIPILIKHSEQEKLIQTRKNFIFDPQQVFEDNLLFEYRDNLDKFDFISTELNNDNYEGQIGLHISFSLDENFTPGRTQGYLSFRKKYYISITQKGILVKRNNSHFFRVLCGYINLKKGLELKLNRTAFSSSQEVNINNFICDFENIILLQIVEKWKNLTRQIQWLNYNRLILDQLNNHTYSNEIVTSIKENFIVKVFINGEYSFLKIKELLENESFLLYEDSRNTLPIQVAPKPRYADIQDLWEKFKIPILDYTQTGTRHFYENLFLNIFEDEILVYDYIGYVKIFTKTPVKYNGYTNFDGAFKGLSLSLTDRSFLNQNHPLIVFIKQSKNAKIFDIYDLIVRITGHLKFYTNEPSAFTNLINDINSNLKLINDIANTNFNIKLEDFKGY